MIFQLLEYKEKYDELNEDFERRVEVELSQSKIDYDNLLHVKDQQLADIERFEEEIQLLKVNSAILEFFSLHLLIKQFRNKKCKLTEQENEFENEKNTLNSLSQSLIENKNEEIDDLLSQLKKLKEKDCENDYDTQINELKKVNHKLDAEIIILVIFFW